VLKRHVEQRPPGPKLWLSQGNLFLLGRAALFAAYLALQAPILQAYLPVTVATTAQLIGAGVSIVVVGPWQKLLEMPFSTPSFHTLFRHTLLHHILDYCVACHPPNVLNPISAGPAALGLYFALQGGGGSTSMGGLQVGAFWAWSTFWAWGLVFAVSMFSAIGYTLTSKAEKHSTPVVTACYNTLQPLILAVILAMIMVRGLLGTSTRPTLNLRTETARLYEHVPSRYDMLHYGRVLVLNVPPAWR